MQVVQTAPSRLSSIRSKVAALTAIATCAALSAPAVMAQVTDPFDTAMTEATEKVGSYAAALVGLGAVAVVFMIALKYVKKIPRAS